MRILHRLSGLCLSALVAAVALVTGATQAQAAPPVWHVRGAHADITLFGSVHLLSQKVDWKTPALLADVAKADEIWFEIPIDPATQSSAAAAVLQKGVLPQGETLPGLLAPAVRDKLDHVAAAEGLSPATLERMKPWLAELMLSIAFFERHGARPDLGVEQQLSAAAPVTAKREAFETVEQQIGFLADAPLKDQADSLKETLDEIETDPGIFDRLVSAWSRGDVAALRKDAVEPLRRDAPGVYRIMLVVRNRRWLGPIERLLRTGSGHVVIVVGVAHLVGADGVPALLRKDGFKVEGP